MNPTEELLQIAKALKSLALAGEASSVVNRLKAIKVSATDIGRSPSVLGLDITEKSTTRLSHLLRQVPTSAKSGGLKDLSLSDLGSRGDWRQYDSVDVKARISESAGSVDLTDAKAASQRAADGFASAKLETLSILENAMHEESDKFLERLKGDWEKLDVLSGREIANIWFRRGSS